MNHQNKGKIEYSGQAAKLSLRVQINLQLKIYVLIW